MPEGSDSPQEAPRERNLLGLGSKFGNSTDGRLPSVSAHEALYEAGGALQGVEQLSIRTAGPIPSSTSIDDALVMSGTKDRKLSGGKQLSMENEANLVSSRSTPKPPLRPSRSTHSCNSDEGTARASESDAMLQLSLPGKSEKDKEKAKKPEPTEKEKALLVQIKELERQLAKEKHRKKQEAKSTAAQEHRRRLIVCSQWLPYTVERTSEGTLVVGQPSSHLSAYEAIHRADVTWVGCAPVPVPEGEQAALREQFEALNCMIVYPPNEVLEEAEGIASEVLWPLFHYIPLSMLDSDIDMINRRWEGYQSLNQVFAKVVGALLGKRLVDTLVWVHDYYLMLLPAMLRESFGSKLKIGWFLHTPFPSAEIYVTLPLRKEILRGVLASNLIGLQIYDYVRHFMTACSRVLGTDVNVESTYILDSLSLTAVTVDAFPAGIDCAKFERMLESAELKDKVIELQRRFDGKKLLLGVDRMDYIKGIPHKLIALETFLEHNPQWAHKIQLVQIATPVRGDTTRYHKLSNKVHKLVGRINGRFGTLEHAPIHYLDQPISTCDMCALCFLADVALITSLREGMSQVAFEFIACQQNRAGVLILSEFAGAAQTLGSGALLVNPFNTDEVSNAIFAALHMPEAEREDRHLNMNDYVNKFTIQYWADDFVTELLTQEQEHDLMALNSPAALPKSELFDSYARTSRRLIILGLLGTLLDYSSFTSMTPISDLLWKDLLFLSSDPRNTVVIVSGRDRALLSKWLGDLPVWICAENGCYYRLGGRSADWQCMLESVDDSWISSIKPVFKYFEERTPGSVTETQEHTITWHYQNADEDFGEIQASDLQMHLEKVLGNQPVEVSLGNKSVQVRPYGVTKGAVLEPVLEALTAYSRSNKQERESNASLHEGSAAHGSGHWSHGGGREAEGDGGVASGCASDAEESSAGDESLDFVLCLGTHSMRDEDLFGNLVKGDAKGEAKDDSKDDNPFSDYLPEQQHTWLARVGNVPSQAHYFVEDETHVAKLLGMLASQQAPALETRSSTASHSPLVSPTIADGLELSKVYVEEPMLLSSPLRNLGEIEEIIATQQLAFFLDYDGTLTPIVDNPSDALLTEETRSVVRALALRYPTAIVSGRARATAQYLVKLEGLYYAGSHGFDIAGPLRSANTDVLSTSAADVEGPPASRARGRPTISYKVADSFRPALEEAAQQVEQKLSHIKGVLVEDNTFSISVHYRMVAEPDRQEVDEAVDELVSKYPMLRRTYGKMVYELRPSEEWDKGKAVRWLLTQIKNDSEDEVFPIYIGDDVTDEDAFGIMSELGGLGIIVSETATRENTLARYALQNPAEVVRFLNHFAQRNEHGAAGVSTSFLESSEPHSTRKSIL